MLAEGGVVGVAERPVELHERVEIDWAGTTDPDRRRFHGDGPYCRGVHRLHEMLIDAAHERFPPADGVVEVMPPSIDGHHAIVEFTGHCVVLTDRAADVVRRRAEDAFGGATQPDVVRWLAGPRGWVGSHDAVLVGRGTGTDRLASTDRHDDHPRVVRSRAHRSDVRVFADDTGIATIGTGLVGRVELSVELFAAEDAVVGAGRRLIAEGLGQVPDGVLVWAQVAPGNARSLRSFLACGFVPVGAEILLGPATTVISSARS